MLPAWNSNDKLPCMYAGAFEVAESPKQSHNLFYWLFKNTSLTTDAPLIIWLQGEIGSSAMQGLFIQNGPIQVTQGFNGKGE